MLNQLDCITINPQICLGQPTIRGMRITGEHPNFAKRTEATLKTLFFLLIYPAGTPPVNVYFAPILTESYD